MHQSEEGKTGRRHGVLHPLDVALQESRDEFVHDGELSLGVLVSNEVDGARNELLLIIELLVGNLDVILFSLEEGLNEAQQLIRNLAVIDGLVEVDDSLCVQKNYIPNIS